MTTKIDSRKIGTCVVHREERERSVSFFSTVTDSTNKDILPDTSLSTSYNSVDYSVIVPLSCIELRKIFKFNNIQVSDYQYDKFLVFLSILFLRTKKNKNSEKGMGARLSARCLKHIIGDYYLEIIKILTVLGIIRKLRNYNTNRGLCLLYGLTEQYRSDNSKKVKLTSKLGPKLKNRLMNYKKDRKDWEFRRRLNPRRNYISKIIYDNLNKTVQLSEKSKEIIERTKNTDREKNIILSTSYIEGRKEPYFKTTRDGRIFNYLTGMDRELRKTLTIDGEETCEIDIPCCQLLCLMSFYHRKCIGNNREAYENIRRAKDGTWYEWITGEPDKKKAKKMVFKTILFKQVKNSPTYKNFAQKAPILSSILDKIQKSGEFNQVSYALKKIEAEIMIDGVMGRLVDMGVNSFPIHDSIVGKKTDKKKIAEIINEEFYKGTGITLNLST